MRVTACRPEINERFIQWGRDACRVVRGAVRSDVEVRVEAVVDGGRRHVEWWGSYAGRGVAGRDGSAWCSGPAPSLTVFLAFSQIPLPTRRPSLSDKFFLKQIALR